jgi:type III secretory pathway component EscV
VLAAAVVCVTAMAISNAVNHDPHAFVLAKVLLLLFDPVYFFPLFDFVILG